MRMFVACLAIACFLPVGASNSGQPLDCSDWVFGEPGIACEDRARDTECGASPFCVKAASLVVVNNDGRFLGLRRTPALPPCGNLGLFRYELVRSDGPEASEQVVGYIDERCVSEVESKADALITVLDPDGAGDLLSFLSFDRITGTVLIPLASRCQRDGGGGQRVSCSTGFYSEEWLVSLTGFTTTESPRVF